MSTNKKVQAADVSPLTEEQTLKIKYNRKAMLDVLIVLAAPLITAFYYYGIRALQLAALSVAAAVICEWAGARIFKVEIHPTDLTGVATGMAVAACLPASSAWWLPCAASAFAIMAVRIPFGSHKNTLFVPAAAGIAFVTVCNAERVFGYGIIPNTIYKTAIYGSEDFVAGDSVAYMLSRGNSIGTNVINYIDILVGNFPGPMGAGCVLAMLGGLVYMIIRRPKNAAAPLSYLAVCFVYALLFPRITTGRLTSAFMELSAGLLLFGAVVFLSNEAVMPTKFWAKICYGAFAGLVLMLMRSFSGFQDCTVFAILLANAVAPFFDEFTGLTKKEKAAAEASASQGEEQPSQTPAEAVTGGELDG